MREIKFRAWSPENKELIYFDNKKAAKDRYIAGHLMMLMANEHYVGKDLLMQYTGLKDKNGVEIYEGDIVKFGTLHNGEFSSSKIENLSGCFGFKCLDEFNPLGWVANFAGEIIEATPYGDIEVIGNIYENSELLESNNE